MQPTTSEPNAKLQSRMGAQGGLAQSARGRWSEILSVLAPELDQAIDQHMSRTPHVPCPNHGGKDGFRLFSGGGGRGFNDTGGGVCNTCGPFSDGFRLLTWVYAQREHGQQSRDFHWSDYPDLKKQVFSDIAFYLTHGYAKNPELRERAPRVMEAKSPEELAKERAEEQARRTKIMQIGQRLWAGAEAQHPVALRYFEDRGATNVVLSDVVRLNGQTPFIGKDVAVSYHPAIILPVSRVQEGTLKVIAVHRIYLEQHPDGRVTKAPVESPKKIMPWGDLEGSAIRLYKVTGNVLAVGEGVETMVSVHSMTGLPAWACVTAWGLENVQIPNEIDTVLIAADFDISNKGQESAKKLADRVQAMGKTAIILSPQEFYNAANPKHAKGVDWDNAYCENPERARKVWEPYIDVNPPMEPNY